VVDTRDPESWDSEWLYLVTRLWTDEIGDAVTYEELSLAAQAFARLLVIESWRRNGVYKWIAAYSLRSERLPERIAARWSGTEH
jgi:hypothetical protein